jgi:hypothetical protein
MICFYQKNLIITKIICISIDILNFLIIFAGMKTKMLYIWSWRGTTTEAVIQAYI